MALRKYIFGLITLCLCIFAMDQSYAQTDQAYQKRLEQIQSLYKDIQKQNADIEVLQDNLNQSGQFISDLKNKENISLLQKIQLQKMMQEAQTLSVELDQNYNKRSSLQDQLESLKKSLLRSIESDLAQAHLMDQKKTQGLMNLHKKVSQMDFPQKSEKPKSLAVTPKVEMIYDPNTVEQWIVLQDLQIYTQDLIEQTQHELSYEKQQNILKQELSHLMNEEMFFGEQGFIQGTARKQNPNAITAARAEDQETAETPSTESPDTEGPEPTDPPQPEDPEVIDPDIPVVEPEDTEIDPDLNTFDNVDEIDPKVQSLMMEGALSDISTQDEQESGFQHNSIDDSNRRLEFMDDPNNLTNAIWSLSPQQGESKVDFLERKVRYLEDILTKLQISSSQVKSNIESPSNDQ